MVAGAGIDAAVFKLHAAVAARAQEQLGRQAHAMAIALTAAVRLLSPAARVTFEQCLKRDTVTAATLAELEPAGPSRGEPRECVGTRRVGKWNDPDQPPVPDHF